ncbi:MAG: hypothetical protein ACJ768_12260 [Gaiellaceae bacterium]
MKARLIPVLAVVALLASAQAATASSHVLRPTTTAGANGWTTVPFGTNIAAALADDVIQPAAPGTGTGYAVSPSSSNYWTAVGIAAPALAQGESITGATAWAYLATGSTRGASLSLYAGQTLLGWTAVPAGQTARWYSVPTMAAPTAAQAADLYVVLVPNGKTTNTAVTAYAAYVDLATVAPAEASTSALAGSAPSSTPNGGGNATTGGPATPVAAALAPIAALTAKPSGVVNVPLTCPALSVFGCAGTVTVELLGATAKKSATEARRRKMVLRTKSKGRHFKIAAGAKAMVPVTLERRTARMLRHAGRARARVTVTTELGGGKTSVASRTVTVRERRTVRRSTKSTPRGGNGH